MNLATEELKKKFGKNLIFKENLSKYELEKEKYEVLNREKLSAAEIIAKSMENISINIIKSFFIY